MLKKSNTSVDSKNFLGFSEEFQNQLLDEKNSLELPRNSKLSESKTNEVLQAILDKFGNHLSREQAITFLAVLFQQGGTARRCDGNLAVKIFNHEVKLSEVRSILRNIGLKNSERKLARALATEIYGISVMLELPGNLSKKITKLYPDVKMSIEDLAWLSDFQSDNEDCPSPLKKYILECFKNKGPSQEGSQKKQKKTGK